jgi:hypothetical protein
VPLAVVVDPLFVAEPLAVDVPPFGPFTVACPLFPFPVFAVEPVAVVVLPFGPVTVAESAVPLRVLVALADPDIVFPRALVAVPVAVTDLPVCFTEPVAVPPRLPVTVCCASAEVSGSASANAIAAVAKFFPVISVSFVLLVKILNCHSHLTRTPSHSRGRYTCKPTCWPILALLALYTRWRALPVSDPYS